jgi:tetratricopeptide (TPR) repeat protein
MRGARPLLALVLLASAASAGRAQSAEAIARLEAARDAEPNNVAALRSLGIAYFKRERFADASSVLEQARTLDPTDRVSTLYAGLSAERVPDYALARDAYNDYLALKRPWYAFGARRTATQVRNRLVAMAHEESIALAKAAVANEAQLAGTPGDLRTIAVPPMKFSGPDADDLAPLERGLAELVITDLGMSKQLVVVERDRMQALADEIQLGATGSVDAATAARAGRLIQAGRLVNGNIVQGGQTLTLSSSIVSVATSELSAPAQVTDGMDRFFDMQKTLVFRIFDQLGVTLTDEERVAIGVKQTNNLDAFLLYSRGLVAADAGQFEQAARLFEQARVADPGFQAAASRAAIAQAAAAGSQVTATTLETSLPRAERTVIASAASGVVVPPTPPGGLIPGIPRLPSVAPAPLGSTLAITVQNVNPPSVSPITNLATRSLQPATPNVDLTGNVTGFDRFVIVQGVVVFPILVLP